MRGHAGAPHYLIDGYNVILSGGFSSGKGRGVHRSGLGTSVDDNRYLFMQVLSEYVRKKRVKVTVVWDGGTSTVHPKSETHNGVQNIFTPQGMSADEQIVRMVEKRGNPREVTVVSDDHRHIIGAARNLGAQTMGVAQFLSLIGVAVRNQRKPKSREAGDLSGEKKNADDLSVDEWMKLFQMKNNTGGNEP